ncbi:MAG: hypothetical protein J5777_09210 [Clostridiales bacterium]|nr:hypothetical protein [Clostridiales bacterium]
MTEMKDVNAHICPTCGGKLSVNIERQMYECPFCGVTFDYDYFREESVLGIAAQALKSKEFDSAERAYDFLLEKEPDNFEALRGKALIAMEITKIDDIRSLDLFSKIDFESAYKEIGRGIESSKPEDREYFTVMKDVVDSGHEYVDEKAGRKTHMDERDSILERLGEAVRDRDTLGIYSPARVRPKKAVIRTVFCYIICCLIVFLGYKYINRNPYAKAEDLSKYEITETSGSRNSKNSNIDGFANWYTNHKKYEEALEREEQRKINYETWEKNHTNSISGLISMLIIATVIFALIVFILIIFSRALDAGISKIHHEMTEKEDKIKSCEARMAELKARINQDYDRLCELHPVSE